MTRGRMAALGLVLTAIVTLVWVLPLVRGPGLECYGTDPATCDRILRFTAHNGGLLSGGGFEQFFPVTSVRIWEGGCQMAVERVYGLLTTQIIC